MPSWAPTDSSKIFNLRKRCVLSSHPAIASHKCSHRRVLLRLTYRLRDVEEITYDLWGFSVDVYNQYCLTPHMGLLKRTRKNDNPEWECHFGLSIMLTKTMFTTSNQKNNLMKDTYVISSIAICKPKAPRPRAWNRAWRFSSCLEILHRSESA